MEEVTIQFVNIPEVSLSEYAEQLEVSNEEALAILEGEGVNMDQPTGDPKVLFDAVVEAVDAYRTAADLEAQAAAILAKARELRRLIGSNVITVQPGAAPKLERTNEAAQHTCGGPVFGRLTDGCPRCDELLAGAPARQGWGRSSRYDGGGYGRHSCQESNCAPVCTWGDW